MKKKFLVLFSCLICCMLFIAGCGVAPLQGGPAANENVYGNGGMVVRKGEYVYFTNAYKSAETITTNENKYGDETVSAIYRVKVANNAVVEYDEDGKPVGAEILVKQISGFEDSGLYIFGNHLYYATPYTLKDIDTGEDINGLIRFCRVNLDGTGWKVIYETKQFEGEAEYFFTQVDGYVFITVYDGKQIVSVKIDGNRVSNKVMAEDVTSASVYQRDDISVDDNLCEFDRYVYYSRSVDKEKDGKEEGTVVGRIKYTDHKATEEKLYVGETSFTIYDVKNNRLYLKVDTEIVSVSEFPFTETSVTRYLLSGSNLADSVIVVEDLNASQETVDGIIKENKQDKGIIGVWNNNMLIHFKGLDNRVVLYDAEAEGKTLTLLYVEDGYVYFTEGGETVYRKNIENPQEVEIVATNVSLSASDAGDSNLFDYEGDYLFYFAKVTDTNEVNAYLHMAKVENGYLSEENAKVGKYIGVLDTADTEEASEDAE